MGEGRRATGANGADAVRSYASGEVVFREGDLGTEMYVIHRGKVEILRRISGPEGREKRLAIFEQGDFFGELSILDGRPRVAQVVTDGPTTCLALASWDFEAVVSEEPGVALAVLRGLAARLRELTEAEHH